MLHLKCLTCMTRLYSTEGDPIGDLCPFCRSPLAALRVSGNDVDGHRALPIFGHRLSPAAATVFSTSGDELSR